jgi:hypothetical protein
MSPGAPGRWGGEGWSQAGGGGRVGHACRAKAWVVLWTTGFFVERRGPVWPPAAPGVERSDSFGLDVKENRGLGQENGGRGREQPLGRRSCTCCDRFRPVLPTSSQASVWGSSPPTGQRTSSASGPKVRPGPFGGSQAGDDQNPKRMTRARSAWDLRWALPILSRP